MSKYELELERRDPDALDAAEDDEEDELEELDSCRRLIFLRRSPSVSSSSSLSGGACQRNQELAR